MASNNFINECKNYANCNRLGELKIRDDLEIRGLEGNTSQTGTPTPDNPINVNTVTGLNEIDIVGKNLFNIDEYPFISKRAYNGTTGAVNSWSGYCGIDNYFPVEPNTTYTFSNNYNANIYYGLCYYDNTKTFISGTNTRTKTFTTPNNCHYIRFAIQNDIPIWVQIEKGNTKTDFEPYKKQSYEINLDSIELCKIGDYKDTIYYQSSSNNLFDSSFITAQTKNGISLTINNGLITITGTATAATNIYYNMTNEFFNLENGETYTISAIGTTTGLRNFGFKKSSGVDLFVVKDDDTNFTKTTTINDEILTYNRFDFYIPNGRTVNASFYILLEKGSQLTEYQPYGSGWFIKKNIGKVVLDGSESWNTWADAGNSGRGFYSYKGDMANTGLETDYNNTLYCDLFSEAEKRVDIVNGLVEKIKHCGGTGSGRQYIAIGLAKSRLADVSSSALAISSFKTWLSNNNVTIYYQLLTTTYTKITDETLIGQIEALMNAKGQFNSTTLLVTSSNLPIIVDNTITEGLTLNQDNYIQEFTIDSGCYVDGEIIGTIYSKKLETKLIDSKTIDLQNKEFISKVGVVYNNNTNEYEELGKFTVESPKEEQTDNASSFVAYDDLINHIDDRYVTELDYDDEGNSITLSDVYEELCRHLELTPVTTTFTNSNIPVNSNPFTNGEKNRDVLKSIEKVSCSYAKIDKWDNTIDLVWLSDTLDYTFTLDDYASLEGGKTIYGPINTLIIRNSEIEEENVSISDQESIEEYGEHQLVIAEDYFLYDAALREAAIQAIWNKVHNLTYVDCKLKTYTGKPFLDIGNKIRVYTDENNYFDTYVLKHEFKFNGAFESVIESPALTEQEIKTKQDITLQEKLRNTQIIVNKQEGTITGLVSKTNEIDVTVNNNYQDLNNKFDGYTPLSRTVNIENSVTTLQTDTYTKTQIDTKLTDGSVTKVMTASGTYDINGMHYEKTNAPTSTTINEVGVGVNKTSDTDYVLFAGYVDDNNTQYTAFKGQTIVASENMLVENYFVVGSKSRMEDYEDGTGVFYIGG